MKRATQQARRCRGDGGAALVEFAFLAVLLCLLLFGIINFGLILSFKQDMTRAAAEGARAGAVVYRPNDDDAERAAATYAATRQATEQAVDGFNQECDVDGLACHINLHSCATDVAPGTPDNPSSTGDCVTVELVYDYDQHPLLPEIPLLSAVLPDTIRDRSVARLNA